VEEKIKKGFDWENLVFFLEYLLKIGKIEMKKDNV